MTFSGSIPRPGQPSQRECMLLDPELASGPVADGTWVLGRSLGGRVSVHHRTLTSSACPWSPIGRDEEHRPGGRVAARACRHWSGSAANSEACQRRGTSHRFLVRDVMRKE